MWRVWLQAARPKTLPAGVCPVIVGTALAARDGGMWLPAAMAALVGAVTIQVGTNFSNDYFDFRQGADTADRLGPRRAVQAGLIPAARMWNATLLVFGVTALVCVYLVARAGWPLALVGAISVACGIGYTASRYSLAYLGLGDLFVLVFFGPVAVAGTYYVQTLQLAPQAILAGLGPGLIATAILVVNNVRDVQQDARAQKRTLAVRWGASFARRQYVACMAGAAAVPALLWRNYHFPPSIVWTSATILPGLWIARQLWLRSGPTLNPLLGLTAGVLLLYTAVFSSICVWV
jgi:1,4-dihydroxy-2-naphthoate octaprenyltransferase